MSADTPPSSVPKWVTAALKQIKESSTSSSGIPESATSATISADESLPRVRPNASERIESDTLKMYVKLSTEMRKTELEMDIIKAQLENSSQEIERSKSELRKLKEGFTNELKEQSNRGQETLGLFAALLALIVINVNIISSAQSFLSAILLIVSLTCTMSIFVSILHVITSHNSGTEIKRSLLHKIFFVPAIFLILLVTIGIISYAKGKDLYIIDAANLTNSDKQNTSHSIAVKPEEVKPDVKTEGRS